LRKEAAKAEVIKGKAHSGKRKDLLHKLQQSQRNFKNAY